MRKILLSAAVAATFLSSAPAIAKPPAVCIRQDELYNWNALSDKKLVIEDIRHRKALLTLIGACTGLKFHEAIAIRSPGGTGLSCISAGDDVTVRDFGMRQRCAIVKVEPYAGDVGKRHDEHGDAHDGDHHEDGDHHDDDRHGGY